MFTTCSLLTPCFHLTPCRCPAGAVKVQVTSAAGSQASFQQSSIIFLPDDSCAAAACEHTAC